MTRVIRLHSIGVPVRDYPLQHDWPPSCFVQAGELCGSPDGRIKPHAFFEVFPDGQPTYFRVVAPTIEAAESGCWEKYQRWLTCPRHEYERRDRRDSHGYCRHCGAFVMHVFIPLDPCVVCGVYKPYTEDTAGNWYCKDHQREKPLELWTDFDWRNAYIEYEFALCRQARSEIGY